MSRETSQWLNQNILIGMTEQRGHAWHYRKADQGSESNHYPGAIPVEEIERRLIPWEAVPVRVATEVPCSHRESDHIGPGGRPSKWVVETDRMAVKANDNWQTLGHHGSGYTIHGYSGWLVEKVEELVGNGALVISSAGLLQDRAVMWLEASVPETRTVCGVSYRPNLLACTSFNAQLSTTYKRTIGEVVCDNTMSAALREASPELKIRHTKHSRVRIEEAQGALAIVSTIGAQFEQTVKALTRKKLSNLQFKEVLNVMVPSPTESVTDAIGDKRKALTTMYYTDERVEPWAGTAFGVLQLFNTWMQHERPIRGGTQRVERNMLDTLSGKVDKTDAQVIEALAGLQLI